MADLNELDAIIRERHQTGAHRDCRLRVGEAVLSAMRERSIPQTLLTDWLGMPFTAPVWVVGIPIDHDPNLPDDGWRLVRVTYEPPGFTRTTTVVREGTVRPEGEPS